MPDRRPVVFIGSSSEGVEIAEAIQVNLDRECEVVIWSQGVFGLGEGTLESLAQCITDFDFAILVLTPDDLITSRDKTQQSARDNVLIELGLFIGAIGRNRTFAVFDREADMKLPSDLAGVTIANYQRHRSGNLRSSVGAPCTLIKHEIRRLGLRDRQNKFAAQMDQSVATRTNRQVRIQPADTTIISNEDISKLPVSPGVVDVVEREAAKIVNSPHVDFLIEMSPNGGTLTMLTPILRHRWTVLEFAYHRSGEDKFGVGYPVTVNEYLSSDDKAVHEVEDAQQLEDLLRTTFSSSTSISKIQKVLQAANSRAAEWDAADHPTTNT